MVRQLIVGVDGSEPSLVALRWAAGLAGQTGATLVVVHVRHTPTIWSENASAFRALKPYIEELQQEASARSAEVLSEAGLPVSFEVRDGDPAEQLNRAAMEMHADLIVVSGHGYRGLDRLLLGSVSTRLVHTASVPVTVVR
jgi:nucleotide-binding universal stress UspA family protein